MKPNIYIETANRDDNARMMWFREERSRTKAEFCRHAIPNGVPETSVHVHEPHEELVKKLLIVGFLAHTAGAGGAAGWSYAFSQSAPYLAAFSAALAYFLLAYGLDAGIRAQFPAAIFLRKFTLLFWPPLLVCSASVLTLLAERFANPELAEKLLALDPYAWIACEFSALMVGAVAYVGHDRFGWSSRLVARYEDCDRQIINIQHRMDQRQPSLHDAEERSNDDMEGRAITEPAPVKSRKPVNGAAALALFGMMSVGMARAECPTIMLDRTGSLVDQPKLEARLVSAMIGYLSKGACAGLVVFSHDVSAAPRYDIRASVRGHVGLGFGPLIKAAETIASRDATGRLMAALRQPLPPATCSSLPDMVTRAAAEEGPTLLITDAVHNCGPSNMRAIRNQQHPTFIVLVRSQSDTGNATDFFERRSKQVLRYLPGAQIFHAFELERSVDLLFSASGRAAQ